MPLSSRCCCRELSETHRATPKNRERSGAATLFSMANLAQNRKVFPISLTESMSANGRSELLTSTNGQSDLL